ncbi:MAG: restriction endonuclease [Verrucomicrobiaceae bacterium]|nr:MAG: restriction endonuclease [Verrucomicrobiaceae bacterium]
MDETFLKRNLLAIGWPEVGDLTNLNTQEKARAAVTKGYPDMKPNAIPGSAGQLRRFAHEMKPGDLIVYPSRIDGQFHLGRVTGPYRHDPSVDAHYCNVRPVEWIKSVRRDLLSLGARHEAGGILTVFQIKNYAEDFLNVLEGKTEPIPPEEDATVAEVTQDIEGTTSDYVKGKLAREFKGYRFQSFIADLLEAMGYRVQHGKKGADGGIDLIAYHDPLCLEPPIIKVQVKAEEGTAKDADISSLVGNLAQNERGLFITLGRFTNASRLRERQHPHLRLIDGDELVDLIYEYYEQAGTRLKAAVPLKRVYIPEPGA